MKVVEIIKDSLKLLGLKEVIEDINNGIENEEIEYMVIAVNTINNNIASNYIELVNSVDVSTNNGLITFDKIAKNNDLLDIKSIRNKSDNITVDFSLKSDGVHLDNGSYTIEYSYFPKEVGIDDNIDYYTKINVRLFSLGVVSEYLFLKGDVEDAYVWDKKFKQNLRGVLRYKRSLILPKRRWL